MKTRKLRRRVMSQLQWLDRLESIGMEYEEAIFVFHDKLAPLNESGRKRKFRRIAQGQLDKQVPASQGS